MKNNDITALLEQLSDRDLHILEALRTHRVLTTALIRRLHFPVGAELRDRGDKVHATEMAASVSAIRVLARLESRGLVARLNRRIGGVRAGSSGITWQIGPSGERLLRALYGDEKRRRYSEPSSDFIAHTLASADLAIQLYELARSGAIELLSVAAEPECWRTFLGPTGARAWLKPDLFAVTAGGDFEHHWFLEADRASEHLPVIVRKALVYRQYMSAGIHQAQHGLFPVVVWVVPNVQRRAAIEGALAGEPTLRELVEQGLFRVVVTDDFSAFITGGGSDPENTSDETATGT